MHKLWIGLQDSILDHIGIWTEMAAEREGGADGKHYKKQHQLPKEKNNNNNDWIRKEGTTIAPSVATTTTIESATRTVLRPRFYSLSKTEMFYKPN